MYKGSSRRGNDDRDETSGLPAFLTLCRVPWCIQQSVQNNISLAVQDFQWKEVERRGVHWPAQQSDILAKLGNENVLTFRARTSLNLRNPACSSTWRNSSRCLHPSTSTSDAWSMSLSKNSRSKRTKSSLWYLVFPRISSKRTTKLWRRTLSAFSPKSLMTSTSKV